MLYVFYFNDKCDLNLCLFKKEIGMNFFFMMNVIMFFVIFIYCFDNIVIF